MKTKRVRRTAHERGIRAALGTLGPVLATKVIPVAKVVLTGLGYTALVGGAAGCFDLPAWGPPAPPRMDSTKQPRLRKAERGAV